MFLFPRDTSVDRFPAPGTWRPATVDGVRTAGLRCPKCRTYASLSEHAIASNGAVAPSVVCPGAGCDFHEFVQLGEWKP